MVWQFRQAWCRYPTGSRVQLCHHFLGERSGKLRKGDRLLEPSSGLPEQQQPEETIQDRGDPLFIPQQEGSSCKERSEWRVVRAHGRKSNPSLPISPC